MQRGLKTAMCREFVQNVPRLGLYAPLMHAWRSADGTLGDGTPRTQGGAVYRKLKSGKMKELSAWYGGSPYKQVYLYRVAGVKNKYGRQKQYVHKLVADAFIPKGKGKEFVHHKNSVENQN